VIKARPFRRGDKGTCEQCGKKFPKKMKKQRFCSAACKTRHHNDRVALALEHYETCPNVKR